MLQSFCTAQAHFSRDSGPASACARQTCRGSASEPCGAVLPSAPGGPAQGLPLLPLLPMHWLGLARPPREAGKGQRPPAHKVRKSSQGGFLPGTAEPARHSAAGGRALV